MSGEYVQGNVRIPNGQCTPGCVSSYCKTGAHCARAWSGSLFSKRVCSTRRFSATQQTIWTPCNSLRPVYSDTTQLNSTHVELSTRSQREQLSPINERSEPLTQFVGHDVINKNTTDLAVRCSTGLVEFS